jgi:type II secretory pathway component PulK
MSPDRRGFALLAALWVLTALTVLTGVSLAVARTGNATTRNRILLARAGWAREACLEILLARYAQNPGVRALDTVDPGRGTWCSARLEDVGAKLNLNLAQASALEGVLRAFVRDTAYADSLAAAIVNLRSQGPLFDVRALGVLPGFDSSLVARLDGALTTRGPGTIDVNSAPPLLLAILPGMTASALAVIGDLQSFGRPPRSTDELEVLLSGTSRSALLSVYPEFLRAATFAPVQFVALVDGGVRGTPIAARATVTLVPTVGRLAVIRRETE